MVEESADVGECLAPRAGFEPATNRLTAGCSTTELPGNAQGKAPYNKRMPALQSVFCAMEELAPARLIANASGR